jgi:hypothetical protein
LFGHTHDVFKTQLAGADSKLDCKRTRYYFFNIMHLFNYNSIVLYVVEIQTWYETLIKEIIQLTFQGTDLRKQLESGQFLL